MWLDAQGRAAWQLGRVEWRLGRAERRLGGAERLGRVERRLSRVAELLGVPLMITPLSELHQPDANGRGGIGWKGMEPKAKASTLPCPTYFRWTPLDSRSIWWTPGGLQVQFILVVAQPNCCP